MQAFARVIYVLGIALLVAMTAGFGLVTFYPEPDAPQYPIDKRLPPIAAPAVAAPGATPTPEEIKQQELARAAQIAYDVAWEQHQRDIQTHHRNALAVAVALGLVFLVGGILAAGALDVLRVGVMLGGLFTILWGLIYAASEAGSGTMFVAALLALVVLGSVATPGVRSRLPFAGSADELLGRHTP